MFRVVRIYFRKPGYKRTILDRVTEEEAKRHCSDPETSSRTCRKSVNISRTLRHGPWFDCYEER